MIKVSIIVQLREHAADGKPAGRAAIGVSEFLSESACPQKSWREKFDAAAIRAQASRTRHLEEIQRDARPAPAEQQSLTFQDVTTPRAIARGVHKSTPKKEGVPQ